MVLKVQAPMMVLQVKALMILEIILVQEYIDKYIPDSNMASITHFKMAKSDLGAHKKKRFVSNQTLN